MRITFDGSSDDTFRSHLERQVAGELTRLGVSWRYEVAVSLPGRSFIPYLPDFTIDVDAAHLGIPTWVECKPQQMLYTLRDVTGVTRRAGEYFKADVTVEGITAADFVAQDQAELAKPKRLAELSGQPVLVVGGVQGTNSLSVLLTESSAVFSRTNPFVNQRGVQRAQEQARRAAESEARMAVWEKQRQEREARDQTMRDQIVAFAVRNLDGMLPRFASPCLGCRTHGTEGQVYRVPYSDGVERWERICLRCCAKAGA